MLQLALPILLALGVHPVVPLHTRLARSEPASGATVAAPPAELRLWFEGGIEAEFTKVALLAGNGARLALGAPARGSEEGLLVVPVPLVLAPDRYTVTWETVGRDGHPIRGEFGFAVAGEPPRTGAGPAVLDSSAFGAGTAGRNPARTPTADAAPHDASGAVAHHPEAYPPGTRPVRWLHLAGLVTAIGAAAMLLLVIPTPEERGRTALDAFLSEAARRVRVVGIVAAIVHLGAAAAWLWLEARMMHGRADLGAAELGRALGTTWGRGWVAGTVAVAAMLVAFAMRRHGRAVERRAGSNLALGAAALVAALGPALTGHAVGAIALMPLAVLADWLHVLAAGIWVGGLAAIVLGAAPAVLAQPATARASAAAWLIGGFHSLAVPGLAAVAASGLLSTWLRVGGWTALTTTSYGGVLLFKLYAVALAAVLGAYHWKRVHPRLGRAAAGDDRETQRLGWTLLLELLVGAVILALTVVLVTMEPPR